MRPEIKEEHLKDYLTAVCEDFFTDYKAQQKCSDLEVMAVVVSALASTLSSMAARVREFQYGD